MTKIIEVHDKEECPRLEECGIQCLALDGQPCVGPEHPDCPLDDQDQRINILETEKEDRIMVNTEAINIRDSRIKALDEQVKECDKLLAHALEDLDKANQNVGIQVERIKILEEQVRLRENTCQEQGDELREWDKVWKAMHLIPSRPDYFANRYDTDNEMVLTIHDNDENTFDIRIPKNMIERILSKSPQTTDDTDKKEGSGNSDEEGGTIPMPNLPPEPETPPPYKDTSEKKPEMWKGLSGCMRCKYYLVNSWREPCRTCQGSGESFEDDDKDTSEANTGPEGFEAHPYSNSCKCFVCKKVRADHVRKMRNPTVEGE